MIRSIGTAALAMALALGGLAAPEQAVGAHHEPVLQAVTVSVAPGKLDAYLGEVKKLNGVLARIGSSATLRVWAATAAGTDTGNVLVGLEYPNAAAWAADQPKTQSDAEWQKILAGLPALRTLEANSLWRDISLNASEGKGSVLVVTGVRVNPGKLDEYRKRVGSTKAISDRLGLTGRLRMWHAELAGEATGNVAVVVEYADLATYVAETGKTAADSEWQALIGGLGDIRSLAGRWMYSEITP